MNDRRRQLGTFAVLSLVLLRVAIGWHFYREGSSKLTYDPRTRHFDVTFSAEGFLSQVKGPLAKRTHSYYPSGHGWSDLLAPQPDPAQSVGEAGGAPYDAWSQQIQLDWTKLWSDVSKVEGITEEQKQAATKALEARKKELSDYLAAQSEAITEYQHDLQRVNDLQATPEAEGVPFVERRITSQLATSRRAPLAWVDQVGKLEQQLKNDLRNVFTAEQRANPTTATAIDDALTSDAERMLRITNTAIAYLIVGVGICLLIGFFTRLASLAGALFLVTVIATQPPWVPGTAETYYQTVELAGLLVLLGTGAGRWFGLDFFSYALWNRIRGR